MRNGFTAPMRITSILPWIGFLKSEQIKHEKYYGINLTALDAYINALPLPNE